MERQSVLVTEEEAVNWIQNGMTVAIGDPAPMSMIRNIIRNRITGLTVIGSGIALDYMIAGGCVSKVISYYAGGGFGVPVAPSFRHEAETGGLEVWECEEGILTSGLEAAGKGLPFLPWRGGVGTSIPEVNKDLRIMEDPINGETLLAVPAIHVDVALLHASKADVYGNVQHQGGPGWIDLFLNRAANRTAVQVEKIVSNEEIRANPWATTISNADGVIRATYGAHPFYSRGHYIQDQTHLKHYLEVASLAVKGDRTYIEDYFSRYIYKASNHIAYLEEIGVKQLLELYEY
jgi:glutaconate CoA-transferase, subunit A